MKWSKDFNSYKDITLRFIFGPLAALILLFLAINSNTVKLSIDLQNAFIVSGFLAGFLGMFVKVRYAIIAVTILTWLSTAVAIVTTTSSLWSVHSNKGFQFILITELSIVFFGWLYSLLVNPENSIFQTIPRAVFTSFVATIAVWYVLMFFY